MLAVEPTNGAIALSLEEDTLRHADIVGFWRTVEMFSPQSVEKVDRIERVFAVRQGQPLPWQPGHEVARERLDDHLTWRHVVYVGIYRLDAMFEVLAQAFEPDEESFDERPPGQSALAAFTVGADGRALLESAVLSSCAWATGQLLEQPDSRQDWVNGFAAGNAAFVFDWKDLVAESDPSHDPDDPPHTSLLPRVLTADDLRECLQLAIEATGIGDALSCTEIRISSQKVSRRKAEAADGSGGEFLNSMILPDLDRIAEQAAEGSISAALADYLRPAAAIPTAERVDVQENPHVVLAATAPGTVPAGRWPSNVSHALALNQQLAVDTALTMPPTGVMGVNGPPGTGKTTMLRDLIAALVVERAGRLADLSDPSKAFTTDKPQWKTGPYTRTISVLRPELTGFEMVVASANNTAVQNVTDEIPAAGAIDHQWLDHAGELDYFPEIASALLAPDSDSKPTWRDPKTGQARAWGLMAARLGNKANRTRFASIFWYRKPDNPDDSLDEDGWIGLNTVLNDYAQGGADQLWAEAVEQFQTAQHRVESLRAERLAIYEAVQRRVGLVAEVAELRSRAEQAAEQARTAHARHEAAQAVARERHNQAERLAVEQHTTAEQAVEESRTGLERLTQGRQASAEQAVASRRAKLDRLISGRQAQAQRIVNAHQTTLDHIRLGRQAHSEQVARSCLAELEQRRRALTAHSEHPPSPQLRIITFGIVSRRWSEQNSALRRDKDAAEQEWTRAESEYASARAEAAAAQRGLDQAVAELREVLAEVGAAQDQVDAAEGELTAVHAAIDAARQTLEAAHRARDRTQRELAAVRAPGLPTAPDAMPTYAKLWTARREAADAEQQLAAATQVLTERQNALTERETDLAELDSQLDSAAAAWGAQYPDSTWWSDRDRRERAALWTDPQWNQARSALFLAALALHKTFLQLAAQPMRRNLQAAMDLISGDAPADAPEHAALAAWQSLFLVVPVVSTTFASYARLFSHLTTQALGWLLIDEAGQATPQAAVGALWRTQRAVMVGDPLQLEPIRPLPFKAEQAIRNELDVDEQWSPSRLSAQRLADRLTRLGTWLPDEEGKIWVGVPLTVHRRCDQPMFGIVNAIAYDGLMIDGTSSGPGEQFTAAYPSLPVSKWIDVAGTTNRGHWIPDEGAQLARILSSLAEFDFDMSSVLVVTPFRAVARELEQLCRRYPAVVAGTVHKSQGKQASIVILVLGSDPERPGARAWAARTPNLLNVAVSRAQRRLYVIGNRRAWASQPHFTVLARELPASPPITS